MPTKKRRRENRIPDARLQKALARLEPPTDDMLLDAPMMEASRKLDAALGRDKYNPREVQQVLDRLARSEPPVMYTRGGTLSPFIRVRDRLSITELLSHLFLPTDDISFWVPAERRYFDAEIATGARGSASAYKNNGKLTCIQMLDTQVQSESTYAAVYIRFRTDPASYGQVNLVTFEPEIDWSFRDIIDHDAARFDRIQGLDGMLWFTARVWLVAYEFNIATGKFDPINPPSSKVYQVYQSTWYTSSLGQTAMTGSLRNGAATFKFIASPARTYALGVVLEARASHNLKNLIPQPPGDAFMAYALFKAEVPEMWVDHQVLA